MRLILASTSPRRREILALLGAPFEIIAPDFDEILSLGLSMEHQVLEFALGKAHAVAGLYPDSIVIGSDTMIECAGEKIGKPRDSNDAARILRLLSGRAHVIHTAVAMVDDTGPGLRTVEQVEVEMRRFSDEEIERYLSCDESLDKAGAYSIQGEGSRLIESLRGDYLAAIGLPLKPVAVYLTQRGVRFPRDVDELYGQKSFMNWSSFA